jgi:hypothetical protein
MAKPNYDFEKRQRELAKKRKKEEKKQRKAGQADGASDEADAGTVEPVATPAEDPPPAP